MSNFVEMAILTPWAKFALYEDVDKSLKQDMADSTGKPILDFTYDGVSGLYVMRRGSENALCFDIRSNVSFKLNKGQKAKVPTGLHISMPGHMGCLMRERSGLADKGIRLHAGTLDADYRGEYFVLISYQPMVDVFSPGTFIDDTIFVNKGDRIAQMYFTPEDPSQLRWKVVNDVDALPISKRGIRGFGSSGSGSF